MNSFSDTESLFVYGSLRQSINNPMSKILRRYASPTGEAYIHGKLYDVGSYPAAIKSEQPSDRVLGELFSLQSPKPVFERLDEYEGYDPQDKSRSLYHRQKIEVFRLNGKKIGYAWTYLFNKPVDNLRPIKEGDYVRYLEMNSKS